MAKYNQPKICPLKVHYRFSLWFPLVPHSNLFSLFIWFKRKNKVFLSFLYHSEAQIQNFQNKLYWNLKEIKNKIIMENISNTCNSIHLFSYSVTIFFIPGTTFHPQRAGLNLQAICLLSFLLALFLAPHDRVIFLSLVWEPSGLLQLPSRLRASSVLLFKSYFRGIWRSPSPIAGLWGLTQCSFFK